MIKKFDVFTDCGQGYLRRYLCDEVDGLHLSVFYRGKTSVFALVSGLPNLPLGADSYEVFADSSGAFEYVLIPFNGALVRFRADNFEDFRIY